MAPRSRAKAQVNSDQLATFLNALHEELERQAKDRSRPYLSDLALDQVNRAIEDGKTAAASIDPFVAELKPFVAAGDNPLVSDALLVLGILRKSLFRIKNTGR